MSKLYACIIAPDAETSDLIAVAQQFAYRIELIDDGILFDVSGLEKLIGDKKKIEKAVLKELQLHNLIGGQIAVHHNIDSVVLLARQNNQADFTANFGRLPLGSLPVHHDTLKVFQMLGIERIEELREIPNQQLVARYGREFQTIIDLVDEKGLRPLISNLKSDKAVWQFELDHPVGNSEQLIFLFNRGIDVLTKQAESMGSSSQELHLKFTLENGGEKIHEIKTSFPTLEKKFWLKLISLRIDSDSPGAAIINLEMSLHFTPPRSVQGGLYAAARPTPENLLLTVNKIKNIVGKENVGIPALVNQRLAEPFELLADELPKGIEKDVERVQPTIVFVWYRPPLAAQVYIKQKRLLYLKTSRFSGRVIAYSGVWKLSSRWWEETWKTHEWDVEVENGGIYRLRKKDNDWFVTGEYD